jgi:hypothetical protein
MGAFASSIRLDPHFVPIKKSSLTRPRPREGGFRRSLRHDFLGYDGNVHTSACPNQISIIPHGEWEVGEGTQAELERAPFRVGSWDSFGGRLNYRRTSKLPQPDNYLRVRQVLSQWISMTNGFRRIKSTGQSSEAWTGHPSWVGIGG